MREGLVDQGDPGGSPGKILVAVPDAALADGIREADRGLAVIWDGVGEPDGDLADVALWVPAKRVASDAQRKAALGRLPRLRAVQLLSAGADVWIDIMPPGVELFDGRGVHGSSTSEWAMAAMLAWLRELPRFVRAQDRGEWDRPFETDELAGKRVMVIGAGDVGASLARRLTAFDALPVLVARRARDGVAAIEQVHELLPEVDVVVLVVPLTDETRGLVDSAFLARVPDGALLVNASRGPVVDTDALVGELRSGRISAALDVTDPEPLPPGHPLWSMPNVLITPHTAGLVSGFSARARALVLDQLRRLDEGLPMRNRVADGY
ncbi:NAD(P)-dependent oxidoreductase [Homoserinibacter sp. GY 40078]|uniref:NAD(P)-dependent oxidoreductase n=1 Tax=Homoserinibacter sp. GY 40078 TaxID=2603275 RepID=UPI0011CC2AF0|nr:NAD(P)-dependent oxidoreductase [Homoserinibacter sp. GY 40078]TXK16376.1 phosphoglycerate dehydrogenase [Homoserinibacter sp. GY 40078]